MIRLRWRSQGPDGFVGFSALLPVGLVALQKSEARWRWQILGIVPPSRSVRHDGFRKQANLAMAAADHAWTRWLGQAGLMEDPAVIELMAEAARQAAIEENDR